MDTSDVLHVILVEDDPCNRETMQLVLEGPRHSVRATDRGSEALAWLEDGPYDMLVMDLRMAEMDGPEILRQVWRQRPTGRPSALFVSGYAYLGPYADDPTVRSLDPLQALQSERSAVGSVAGAHASLIMLGFDGYGNGAAYTRTRRFSQRASVSWAVWVQAGQQRMRCHAIDACARGAEIRPRGLLRVGNPCRWSSSSPMGGGCGPRA